MNILLLTSDSVLQNFMVTSVIRGLNKQFQNVNLFIVTGQNEQCVDVFRHNRKVSYVCTKTHLLKSFPVQIFDKQFDLLINLNIKQNYLPSIFGDRSKQCRGFSFNEQEQTLTQVLYGSKKTGRTIFQLFFELAGLKWRGQCFDLHYYPKNKSSDKKIGAILANDNLKKYVINNFTGNTQIQYKNTSGSIFARFDVINKHKQIITDDLLTACIAVHLKKEIYFLKSIPYNYKLQLFGRGNIIQVPLFVVQ